ncbi:MAG: AAA family ATPase, partial [Candidatus Bathyarchaeia archaeon]
AATNRPDIIDPALLRPGRFDKLIYVPPPDHKTLIQIFKIHTREMPLAEDVDLKELARMCVGYSGADVEALCREAALNALRSDPKANKVTFEDFRKAMDRIKPSVTSDMEAWYQNFVKRLRKEKATPPMTIS